ERSSNGTTEQENGVGHGLDRRRRPRGGEEIGRRRGTRPGARSRSRKGRTPRRRDQGAGGDAAFLAADLSSLAEVRGLAGTVRQTTDRLDLLINNAGIGSGGPQAT